MGLMGWDDSSMGVRIVGGGGVGRTLGDGRLKGVRSLEVVCTVRKYNHKKS